MNTMKRMQKKASLLMILAALSALPAAAAVENNQFHGKRAWTDFFELEADGCTTHGSSIDVTETTEGAVQITFNAYRYTSCSGENLPVFVLYGIADLPREAFQVQGNLHGATLNATFQILDEVSGTSLPVTIALEWTGLGDVTRGTYRSRYSDGNIFTRLISSGSLRDAQASGSVVIQGVEMLNDLSGGGLASHHFGSTTRQGI